MKKRAASNHQPPRNSRRRRGGETAGSSVAVRRDKSGEQWLFVHPRCVVERADDLEEVLLMIEADELDVAIDELRWLIEGCRDFIQAHQLLGELALKADRDTRLARGHFGFAYRLGCQALRRAGMPSPLRFQHPANRPFFEAGRSLAWCLHELGMRHQGEEIVAQLLACDPSDELGLRAWWDELGAGGRPIVSLETDTTKRDK